MAKYRVQGPDGAVHVFEGPDGASQDQVLAFAQQHFAAPEPQPEAPKPESFAGHIGNLLAGAVRGAGSIGATVVDAARSLGDAATAATPAKMRPDVTAGNATAPRGAEMRSGMDAGLHEMGADPDSLLYKTGKVGTEVAGTIGAGGALGKAAEASGMVAPIIKGLTTGGMDVAGAKGAAGLATRAATGAVTGGASAGMVDPKDAGAGAVIGAAAPVVLKGAGALMEKVGGAAEKGSAGAQHGAQKLAAARAGADAGYVVPPADLQPGILMQGLSGLSGKIKTSQVASERNQAVTDKLARRALGLDDAAELTPDALQGVRKAAGQAYQALRGTGAVAADESFLKRLDQIAAVSKGASRSFPGLKENGVDDLIAAVRQPTFDAGDAIDATMLLRDTADKAFRQGDTTLGRAAKGAATALEDQLERHLSAAGDTGAVDAFQKARKLIAKSYSVQSALNPTTGSVSAPKLAAQMQKGKPLSDELRQVAEFSTAFPKATQALKEAPGAVSPLDWLFAGGAGLSAGSSPVGAAALAARPIARSVLLSKPAQAAMLREPGPPSELLDFFSRQALPAGVRALPVIGSSRE